MTDRARLEAWRNALVTLRDQVQSQIKAGKTEAEVLAAKLAEPYAKEWPGGHERFVQAVYQELSGR